jgi:hypothetical protein
MDHDWMRESEGIRFDAVELADEYPDTLLVLRFGSVPGGSFGVADPNCVFATRWPLWPAPDPDPAETASDLYIAFIEFLGTDPRAYVVRGGSLRCDPTNINWLN